MLEQKGRRYSLPAKVNEDITQVIILDDIEENDDEEIENNDLPQISVCKDQNVTKNKQVKTVVIAKQPPDGGYGWVIVVASFLCFFVIDGTVYSFGIFFDSFVKKFKSSKGLTSMSGSLLGGIYQASGPIASALVHKYGNRKIAIIGSLISAISLYASSFLTNIYGHLIIYGVINGIGMGLLYLPSIVIVSSYFTSNRALATGIASSGSGFGAILYSLISPILLDKLSLKSCICLISLIVATIGVFASNLMLPLEQKISLIVEDENEELLKPNKEIEENNNLVLNKKKRRKNNLFVQPIDSDFNGRIFGQRAISECVAPNLNILDSNLQNCNSESKTNSRSMYLSTKSNSLMFKRHDVFYSGSTLHIQQNSLNNLRVDHKKLNLDDNTSNLVTLKKEKKENFLSSLHNWYLNKLGKKIKSKPITEKKQRKMTSVPDDEDKDNSLQLFKEMMNISLFKESTSFTLFAIGCFLSMMSLYIPFIYINQYAEQNVKRNGKLLSPNESALLISAIGFTNTIGRLFFGWLSDCIKKKMLINVFILRHLTVSMIYNYSILFAGIAVFLIPFVINYYYLMIISLIFGLCMSAFISLASILLVDLLGLEKLTNSFGLISFGRGIGAIIGPPIAGLLFDLTNSYDFTFYITGFFFLVATIFSILASSNSNKELNSIELKTDPINENLNEVKFKLSKDQDLEEINLELN